MCLPPSMHVVQQLKCLIKENCSRTQTTFRCMHAGVNVGSWNQPWIVSKKTMFNFHQLPDRLFKSIHLSTRSKSSIPLLQSLIVLLICFLVTIQKQGFETQKAFCKDRHHASGISVAVYIYTSYLKIQTVVQGEKKSLPQKKGIKQVLPQSSIRTKCLTMICTNRMRELWDLQTTPSKLPPAANCSVIQYHLDFPSSLSIAHIHMCAADYPRKP